MSEVGPFGGFILSTVPWIVCRKEHRNGAIMGYPAELAECPLCMADREAEQKPFVDDYEAIARRRKQIAEEEAAAIEAELAKSLGPSKPRDPNTGPNGEYIWTGPEV